MQASTEAFWTGFSQLQWYTLNTPWSSCTNTGWRVCKRVRKHRIREKHNDLGIDRARGNPDVYILRHVSKSQTLCDSWAGSPSLCGRYRECRAALSVSFRLDHVHSRHHHQPGVYHSTPLDCYHHNNKAIYRLPHPESSIPQLSSQEWQPVVREKADIIMYWLASKFSEGLIKTNYIMKSATSLELIWSTQLTVTRNWGCTWIGAFD